MNSTRGDTFIELLCSGGDDSNATALLHELFTGYPVDNLRRLIHCDEPIAVKAGAWLLSELGPRAAVLMDEITFLLHHDLRYARFFAVDAVLASATPDHGETVAVAVSLIDDGDAAVRWKVMDLLAHLPRAVLIASLPHLTTQPLAALARWLVNLEEDTEADQMIVKRLASPEGTERRVGAAGAARIADRSPDPLRAATRSEDREVGGFAVDELKLRDLRR